jgi:hypothetical protein
MINDKIEIPLTSFIDFVCKSGSPKMTCATKINEQLHEAYDPAKDYYKRFREAIQQLHQKGLNKKELINLIGLLPEGKVNNYKMMEAGYKKFLGYKNITWFQPPRKNWVQGHLNISINPEVGLKWDDKKHVIKLYLKADKPTKDKISTVLALMKNIFQDKDCSYSLLDVRNGKLYLYEDHMQALMPLVNAEAQALALILNQF